MKPPRVAFEGRIARVVLEDAPMPDGSVVPYEIVHHPGGAAVAALDDRRRVCLLRQYRHVVRDWLWELPAGKLEPGQAPLTTARQELAEEAGVAAAQWTALGAIHSSPGIFTEVVHLFLARDLTATARAPEPGEVMEVHWLHLDDAVARALDGRISDGKSIAALLRAREHLRVA